MTTRTSHILSKLAIATAIASSSIMAQTATQSTATSTAPVAQEVPVAPVATPITDTYVRLYVMYYTVSSFELLADLIESDMASDPAILSQCNVIILENIPDVVYQRMPIEFQQYFNAIIPLEKTAAANIAALANGDTKGLEDISKNLVAQKAALSSSYPAATAQLNNMEAATALITQELGLEQFQTDYTKAHDKELQSDPKAMAPMLRAMSTHIMAQIKAIPASSL